MHKSYSSVLMAGTTANERMFLRESEGINKLGSLHASGSEEGHGTYTLGKATVEGSLFALGL